MLHSGIQKQIKKLARHEKNKLSGIENNAQVNNISNSNATELTSGLTTNLHNHNNFYYTKTEIDNYLINGGIIF